MFKINIDNPSGLEVINITNPQLGIKLEIIASFGAVINRFVVNNSPFSFIAGYADHKDLIENHPFFSRSAKLFPFPNRLAQGRYTFSGDSYQLPANFPWSEHAVHGLLYNQAFSIQETHADENQARVTLQFDSSQLKSEGYPFPFRLSVTFTLDTTGLLQCETHVVNAGERAMPYGDAWHPYFNLGVPRDSFTLEISPCQEWLHVDDLPSGEKRAFSTFAQPKTLDGVELNHCFEFENPSQGQLTLKRLDGKAQLNYAQQSGYPFVQLYTPNSESSVAIEPMTCPANAFNNGFGLLELEPGQTSSFQWQCQAIYTG
ncbi:aldose 1-epimerase [Vibrio agarivorans]|uniref:Aldose 1-epimerase n=1 Tax=Vibrio agarivorans TaxID=153622 RepID=A0ABT7Y2T3_9VIBR|nr:aldose 1-epimerase [Vibrio agarivorans]MDN2482296.1 aldose 1-epimerase [Vibrio agarivorans]